MQQDVAINYSTLSKSTVIYRICDLVPRNPSISSCNFMLRATHLFIAHNWYQSDSTISYIANWYLWCRILWTLVFRITVHLMKWRHCRWNFEMNIFLIWKKLLVIFMTLNMCNSCYICELSDQKNMLMLACKNRFSDKSCVSSTVEFKRKWILCECLFDVRYAT